MIVRGVSLTALMLFSYFAFAQQVPYPDYLKNPSFRMNCDPSNPVRTIDGSCNNLTNINYGQAGAVFERLNGSYYANNSGNDMHTDLPSPRLLSNLLCSQELSNTSGKKFTGLMFSFLQFIDHDLTATIAGDAEEANIPVPTGDVFFDPNATGTQVIHFTRSHKETGSGTSAENPAQHVNAITAWLDGSAVYGSDLERANWLRSFQQGKLKVSPSSNGDLLPCNTVDGDCNSAIDPSAPHMEMEVDRCGDYVKLFVAGDVRANEQPSLITMHTLFVREHNRICDELIAQGYETDENIYQEARKRVVGIISSVLYNEVLPVLGIDLGAYRYDPSLNPNILEEFAQAGYRLGHTMVSSTLRFRNKEGNKIQILDGAIQSNGFLLDGTMCMSQADEPKMRSGDMPIRDAFFNPSLIANNGIDNLFNGLKYQMQEEIDQHIVDDIRNFLFGLPGQGGFDLASLNIQRGRDHGLPDFNSLRIALGLSPYTDFNISNNLDYNQSLSEAYQEVDKIDPWIGLVSEKYMAGKNVGETLHALLSLQFKAIRNGDRFYYMNDSTLTQSVKNEITTTTLEQVIMRNTENVVSMNNAFLADDLSDCCRY